ncbi:MAG TPA: ABC transporter ATP-binding protein [Burkholderiales bacterium]|nr:ABC transporter ATP-binding protein [Burkholderiales bacterium]
MLRAEALGLGYAGRMLIEGLSVDLRAGEVWGVLGRNGSGKSTLLHALAGLRPPDAGAVSLDGEPLGTLPRRRLARRVGVLLQQDSGEFWGSTRDYVLLGRYPHARSPFGWSAEDERIADGELGLHHLDGLAHRAFVSLSGGERQRARAAALFTQRPAAYLLDEPLQNLDLPHQVAMLERLALEARERGALVLMVLHDLLFAARYCSRFLLLSGEGRWHAGGAADAFSAARLGELYGFALTPVDAGGERLFLPQRPSGPGPHV